MAEPIRVGLIGCGNNMVGGHLPRLLAHEEVAIAALVDPVEAARARARQADASLAEVPAFEDHQVMLREVQPEAVVISTPHALHHRQIVDSLHAGAHVLVEKPMVNTVAEAQEVIAARDAVGKIVLVSYQRHFQSTFRQMRQVIADGGLGNVEFVTALQNQQWYAMMLRRPEQPWRVRRELSGGGQLNDSGSHLVDILLHVTGLVPERVFALQQQFTLDVDVNSAIVAQFQGGAIATVAIVGQAPCIGGQVWEDITIYGSKGALYYRMLGQPNRRPRLEWRRLGGSRTARLPALPADSTPDQNFVDAIRGRATVGVPAEAGLRVAQFSEAVWRSAERGEPVVVTA